MRIETRFDNASSEYELIWHRPDGSTESERFSTEGAYRARLKSIEEALKTEHWNINGSPQILSEGWRETGGKSSKMN